MPASVRSTARLAAAVTAIVALVVTGCAAEDGVAAAPTPGGSVGSTTGAVSTGGSTAAGPTSDPRTTEATGPVPTAGDPGSSEVQATELPPGDPTDPAVLGAWYAGLVAQELASLAPDLDRAELAECAGDAFGRLPAEDLALVSDFMIESGPSPDLTTAQEPQLSDAGEKVMDQYMEACFDLGDITEGSISFSTSVEVPLSLTDEAEPSSIDPCLLIDPFQLYPDLQDGVADSTTTALGDGPGCRWSSTDDALQVTAAVVAGVDPDAVQAASLPDGVEVDDVGDAAYLHWTFGLYIVQGSTVYNVTITQDGAGLQDQEPYLVLGGQLAATLG